MINNERALNKNRKKLTAVAFFVWGIFIPVFLIAQAPPASVPDTASGISNSVEAKDIRVWSAGNKVMIDFTGTNQTEAVIALYQITGQLISEEKISNTSMYVKEINGISTGYVIVKIISEDYLIARKIFISGNQ